MKCINIINIHNKKCSLKEFIQDLNNEEREFAGEENINQRDLLADYKKLLLLLEDEISNHKHSSFSDDISQVDNFHTVPASNSAQYRISSFVYLYNNQNKRIISIPPTSSLNK